MRICRFKKNELIAYCYGELSQEKRGEVERHLTLCQDCLSKVKSIEKTLSLIKEQRLKEAPLELLANYSRQIRERLRREFRPGFPSVFYQGFLDWLENLRPAFPPRLIPLTLTVCLALFIFALIARLRYEPANLINQEIALLEQLGEEPVEVFVESDETLLSDEFKDLDAIMFAQAPEEIEPEEVLDELELLEELGEENIDEEVLENLKMLDELEMGLSVS